MTSNYQYHDIFQCTQPHMAHPMFIGSVKAASALEAIIELVSDQLDRDDQGLNLKLYPIPAKDGTTIYRPGINKVPLYSATTDPVL